MENGFVASFNYQKVLVIGSYTTKQESIICFSVVFMLTSQKSYIQQVSVSLMT